MRKLIKILLKDKIIFIAIGVTLFIGFLSLKELDFKPIQLSYIDKIYHAIAYFVLALTWLLSYRNLKQKSSVKYVIAFACVVYGTVIEVLQASLTTYRTASFLDVVANTVGVFVALIIINTVSKKINAI